MSNALNEGTSKELNQQKKDEETRHKNFKPKNPNIKNHLGSQKIDDNVFGGMESHKDNIVPYERNFKKPVDAAAENVSSTDINKAIKEEVKRHGIDKALADYPPKSSQEVEQSRTQEIEEELTAEKEKQVMKNVE